MQIVSLLTTVEVYRQSILVLIKLKAPAECSQYNQAIDGYVNGLGQLAAEANIEALVAN